MPRPNPVQRCRAMGPSRGVSASSLWTPTLLNGNVLWLKANGSYETTFGGGGGAVAAGGPVGRWRDASGAGNHADAPSDAKRPTRSTDGRGVKGNGSSLTLLTPATTLPAVAGAGWSVFFKWRRTSVASDSTAAIAYRTFNDYRWGNFGTGGVGAYFDGTVRQPIAPADLNENVVGIVAATSGGGTLYNHDGTTRAFVNYPDTVAIGLSVLSHNDAADGQFSNDTIIELVAYNRALSATEAARVRTYLATV